MNSIKYSEIKRGQCFKINLEHGQFFKKIKLGRKIVALPMTGGFTFLNPIGCMPNLKVFPYVNTSFTKTPADKYLEVSYNTDIGKVCLTLEYRATQALTNEENANVFIERAKILENLVLQELIARKLPYKTELIMLTFMDAVESISSGIDVRSKMKNDELAVMFVMGYEKKYNETLTFCNDTIKMFEETGRKESYMKRCKIYDSHNEFVDEFQFNIRKFGMSDFEVSLDTFYNAADNLLQSLIEKQKK